MKIKITEEDLIFDELLSLEFNDTLFRKNIKKLVYINIIILGIYFLFVAIAKVVTQGINFNMVQAILFIFLTYGKLFAWILILINLIILCMILKKFKWIKNDYILKKYSYLIGTFDITINNNILTLKSDKKNIRLDLKNISVKNTTDSIILTNKNHFKVLLPVHRLDDKSEFIDVLNHCIELAK